MGYLWVSMVIMGLCQVKSSCQHSLMNSWLNSPVGRIVVHLALRLMYAKRTRTRILRMIQFGSLLDPAGFFVLECR
jgi:uncharacterized protein YacL (UPF0231 family)